MALVAKPSYEKLKTEGEFKEAEEEKRTFRRIRGWLRFRKLKGKKRPKIRIPGLWRFLRRRSRLISAVRVSWRKVLKRLKKGQAQAMNDLFAGNFLFMQVISPAPPFKGINKSDVPQFHDVNGSSSQHSLGRIG